MSVGWTTFSKKGGNKVSRGVWRAPRGLFFYISLVKKLGLTGILDSVYFVVDLGHLNRGYLHMSSGGEVGMDATPNRYPKVSTGPLALFVLIS